MIEGLLQMRETMPLQEMCARLGEVLGMEKPVPLAVLLRAIDDPTFAADLITCRNAPGFLAALFDQSRTRAYAQPEATRTSLQALAAKAASALIRWGKAGFSTVDQTILEQRESACLACPNLREPQAAVQKLVPTAVASDRVGSRLGNKICALCGCVAGPKIRLPTETCPDPHPVYANLTRWREPSVA